MIEHKMQFTFYYFFFIFEKLFDKQMLLQNIECILVNFVTLEFYLTNNYNSNLLIGVARMGNTLCKIF